MTNNTYIVPLSTKWAQHGLARGLILSVLEMLGGIAPWFIVELALEPFLFGPQLAYHRRLLEEQELIAFSRTDAPTLKTYLDAFLGRIKKSTSLAHMASNVEIFISEGGYKQAKFLRIVRLTQTPKNDKEADSANLLAVTVSCFLDDINNIYINQSSCLLIKGAARDDDDDFSLSEFDFDSFGEGRDLSMKDYDAAIAGLWEQYFGVLGYSQAETLKILTRLHGADKVAQAIKKMAAQHRRKPIKYPGDYLVAMLKNAHQEGDHEEPERNSAGRNTTTSREEYLRSIAAS